MARKGKSKRIDKDSLHPFIAEGLTQGEEEHRAAQEEYSKPRPAIEVVRNLSNVTHVGRVPTPKFVAQENDTIITDETGRTMHDVNIGLNPETRRAMADGFICLRCLEPQVFAFPEECDLCGYAMRERQKLDMVMEFRGEMHLGPGKPISKYLEEQDLRVEKQKFEQRILEGRSRMRGARAS